MAIIIITVNQKGVRVDSIEKLIEKHIKDKYPNAYISVERKEPAESRADRLNEAESLTQDAKSIVEELRDELQEWHDNLPDNFQQGDKGSQLEDAVQELETIIDALDGIDFGSVSFPTMYG